MSASPFAAQEIKSAAWARYYARHGTSFARLAAPRIRALYEATYGEEAGRLVLGAAGRVRSPSISSPTATG